MPYTENKKLILEGCQIMTNRGRGQFRNFAANATNFAPAGMRRFFNIVIPNAEEAERLMADEWPVNSWTPNPTEEEPNPETSYRMEVQIKYRDRMGNLFEDKRKPRVVMRCNGVQTLLDEETIGMLDGSDIIDADLELSQRHWENSRGETGVTAYLHTGYFNIELDDPFAEKYADDERTIYGPAADDESDIPFD